MLRELLHEFILKVYDGEVIHEDVLRFVNVVYLDQSDYLEAVSDPKIQVSQNAPTTTSKNIFSSLEHLKVWRRTNSMPLISKTDLSQHPPTG